MNKQKLTAIISSVLVVALIVAFVLLKDKDFSKKDDEPATESESINVLDLEDKAEEITIINEGNEFTFIKEVEYKEVIDDSEEAKEGEGEEEKTKEVEVVNWKLVKPDDIKYYDENMLKNIATTLNVIVATEEIKDDEVLEDDAYGFDNPVEVKIKTKDKEENLEFGNETLDKMGMYLRKKNEKTVYIVSTGGFSDLKLTREALLDKEFVSVRTEDIAKFIFNKKGKLEYEAEKTGDEKWEILKPLKAEIDTSKFGSVLDSIASIQVLEFVDTLENKDKYGLDDPEYSFTIKTKSDKEITVLLGNETEGGSKVYATLEGRDDIAIIDQSNFLFLDKPIKDIMVLFAYIPSITDVSDLKLTINSETISSTINSSDGDNEKDEFTVNGVDIKKKDKDKGDEVFRNFYQACIGITIDKVDIDTTEVTGEPEIIIEYKLKKAPGKFKVELISKDSEYYYVMKNGEFANILVKKSLISEGEESLQTRLKELKDYIEEIK